MNSDWVSAGSSDSEPGPARPPLTGQEPGQPASEQPAAAEPRPAGWPEPIGRPARPHWWSIQEPPPAGQISARRAYLEVLGVFAAFFAAGIVAGGETLARRYPSPAGSWAVFTPATITELAMAALAVAVTVLLSGRRGITPRALGLGLPRKADGGVAAASAFRIGVWAIMALVLGGVITSVLATGHLAQPAIMDNSYLMYATAASISAGVIEETVVLAFVVTTLRQAGRPLAEVLAVAVVLRCSYHDYYGPGVVGIAVWAALFVWLFLRAGSVIPLVVVHFLWDWTIFWAQRWHWINAARVIGVLLLLAVATASWLAEVSKRNSGTRPRSGGGPGTAYTAWPFTDQPQQPPRQELPDPAIQVIPGDCRARAGGFPGRGGRRADHGTLGRPERSVSGDRGFAMMITDESRALGGALPCAGKLSWWWRRVGVRGGESFLVAEDFTGNRADDYPWVENYPPRRRKLSLTRKTSAARSPRDLERLSTRSACVTAPAARPTGTGRSSSPLHR